MIKCSTCTNYTHGIEGQCPQCFREQRFSEGLDPGELFTVRYVEMLDEKYSRRLDEWLHAGLPDGPLEAL